MFLGSAHMFLAGCWFSLGQFNLGLGSIVIGLIIPGLIFTFS